MEPPMLIGSLQPSQWWIGIMATIISIASGKGGVGKSIVAGNLGLVLASMGKRVILVDLDVGGADLHIMFGLLHPAATLSDFLSRRVDSLDAIAYPVSTQRGLRLIAGTGDTLATANMPYAKKKRLIRHLRQMEADIMIVDVGAGTGYHALDFFLLADLHVVVATPDPTSVLDLYRFIKLAAIRRVLSNFLSNDPINTALAERDFGGVEEIVLASGQTDHAGQAIARQALQSFRPRLILNRTTTRSKVNTLQLQKLLRDYVGGEMVLLGEIPDDRAVERSVRTYLPVAESAPGSPAGQAFLRIAGQLRAACMIETAQEAVSGGELARLIQ
jgi:flagellar biosynthesis protein FlhG